MTLNQLKQYINKDLVFYEIHRMLLQRWQHSNDPELKVKPYQVRYNELSLCDGCSFTQGLTLLVRHKRDYGTHAFA